MATADPPETETRVTAPPLRFDAAGHILPLTEAEQAQYVEAARQGMARLAAIPDGPDEDDRDFFRAIDGSRPDRPLFQGLY